MTWRVELGDSREQLRALDDASVDAVVTDPPYELGFMSKKWDASGIAYDVGLWREVLRVLKPGGHLLAFGGTRTYHRMACAIEDAGFEIRDSIHWIYGSGFPKGLRPVPHMWQHAKSCLSKEAAPHVVQVSPCLRPALHAGKERTALALAVIQPEGVPALLTETGREEGSFEVTVTLLSESEMRQAATDWSMISSWKGLSDDAFDAVNMSIIETTSNTITVQKILSCLIGQNTPSSIRYSVTIPDGSQWPACDAGSLLSGERLKSQHIPVLTALAPATKNPLRDWQGWNVNLKPSHEPIVVARKPLIGTVAQNVLEHGTGALNIDGCRVRLGVGEDTRRKPVATSGWCLSGSPTSGSMDDSALTGRWPSNVIFSHLPECVKVGEKEVAAPVINRFVDGMKPFGKGAGHSYVTVGGGTETVDIWSCADGCAVAELDAQSGDTGGASRFFPAFRYQAKPARSERETGLKEAGLSAIHPTVKPVELMRWLVRLVTPPGGVVLDPFTGSGTTGCAAILERCSFVGVELSEEYRAIACARIKAAEAGRPCEQLDLFGGW